jgi:hypothetical protein
MRTYLDCIPCFFKQALVGNFEALSEENLPIFFLFMAKCPVVAKDVGCNIGDIILLSNSGKMRKHWLNKDILEIS